MILDAPVTLILIAANLLVGFHTLVMDPELVDRWAFKPALVARGREPWRFVTAAFVHVGFAHLAFNLFTLYFFGPVVEAQIGPIRYIALYLGADLAANALTLWRHRRREDYSAVGASGAIAGVLFSFCLFHPLAPIYVFFIPVGIPAALFGVLYLGISTYAAAQGGGRVAHEAHIGGALGGVLLTLLLYPAAWSIFLAQLAAR